VFYGANFVDYIGYVDDKLLLVRPVNGKNYDSFIYGQYFDLDLVIDGAQAPDKHTLKTIQAIDAIPENVTYEQRGLVEYARSLYDQIATLEQQALVTNYDKLLAAEARIRALTPQPVAVPEKGLAVWQILLIIGLSLIGLALLFFIGTVIYAKIKANQEQRPFCEVFKAFWKKLLKCKKKPIEVAQVQAIEEVREVISAEEATAEKKISQAKESVEVTVELIESDEETEPQEDVAQPEKEEQ
jgi:hypothetical protein